MVMLFFSTFLSCLSCATASFATVYQIHLMDYATVAYPDMQRWHKVNDTPSHNYLFEHHDSSVSPLGASEGPSTTTSLVVQKGGGRGGLPDGDGGVADRATRGAWSAGSGTGLTHYLTGPETTSQHPVTVSGLCGIEPLRDGQAHRSF